MNSREDLHFNLREWPTGSASVDQELREVIDRAFDLEAVARELLDVTAGFEPVREEHQRLGAVLDGLNPTSLKGKRSQ